MILASPPYENANQPLIPSRKMETPKVVEWLNSSQPACSFLIFSGPDKQDSIVTLPVAFSIDGGEIRINSDIPLKYKDYLSDGSSVTFFSYSDYSIDRLSPTAPDQPIYDCRVTVHGTLSLKNGESEGKTEMTIKIPPDLTGAGIVSEREELKPEVGILEENDILKKDLCGVLSVKDDDGEIRPMVMWYILEGNKILLTTRIHGKKGKISKKLQWIRNKNISSLCLHAPRSKLKDFITLEGGVDGGFDEMNSINKAINAKYGNYKRDDNPHEIISFVVS